jgi:hypothetical protein
MKPEVKKAMAAAQEARHKLRIGAISLDEAKIRVKPYIDMVNEGGKRLSKEYGNSFRPVSATGFLR